jgi:lactate permease
MNLSTLLLALSPLLLLTGAVALFNLTTFRAGLATLALLALAAWGLPGVEPLDVWARALPDAVILSLTVIYTLFFGLLLYQLMEGSGALATLLKGVALLGRDGVERLIWVLLVFGPLFESISGFGLAIVIVIPMLRGLGYGPLQTMVLSLISQLAVPWGALAIGMSLGAVMTGMDLAATGASTAVIAAGGFVAFWVMALRLARPGEALRPVGLLKSTAALAVLSIGVWGANRWISPELGGVIGAAALAAWLQLSGGGLQRGAVARLPPMATLRRAAAPYGVLVGLLIGSRYCTAAQEWLTGHLLLRFPDGAFSLPLLYNPGASLAVACVVAWLLFRRGQLNVQEALASTGWQLWAAGRAVFVLILVARVMYEAGMTRVLAEGAAALPGALGVAAVPLIAGLGGFLTGSVAAANALFINFQVDVAARLALPVMWVVAVQNAISAAFTAFSPARLVFAATMTGQPHKEGEAMRRMAPLALALILLGALALSPWGLHFLLSLQPWLVGGQ